MEADVLQVGIIGAGTMGGIHAESITRSGIARVAKVYSPNTGALNLAPKHGAEAVGSAAEVFDDAKIDVVLIASPTDTHAEYLRLARAAGKHVLCEKPVVRTEAEADELERLFQGFEKKVSVGHVVRFAPEYVALKNTIDAGTIGAVGTIRLGRCGCFPVGRHDWFGDFQRSGGTILDLMVHDLDTVEWCFGPIERVYAMRSRNMGDLRKDYALAALRMKSGAIGHLEASWVEAPATFYTNYEVSGAAGLVEYDSRVEPTLTLHVKDSGTGQPGGVMLPQSPAAVGPYELEIRNYLGAVLHDTPLVVTLADGIRAARVALATLRSSEVGQPVAV
jgi:UDP-N-acetylglucosamine 3-dehydrogenase